MDLKVQQVAKTRQLNINIPGRVKKVKTSNFLVPLFEAISNAIHSIDDGASGGTIRIDILRQSKTISTDDSEVYEEDSITGFKITDSGTGFTDANMASFYEADSTHKAKRGGKGVGRFSWLKFFLQAKIDSTYFEKSAMSAPRRRSFIFSSTGIGDERIVDLDATAPAETITTLSPLKVEFEPKTRKSHDDIAAAIVEHFTPYLVNKGMPPTVLFDGVAKIDILDLYSKSIGKSAINMTFQIDDSIFSCVGLRISSRGHGNAAHLCADKRSAEKVALSKLDALFTKRFQDEHSLSSFAFQVFVESEYLDTIVNDDRDGFQFPNQESDDGLGHKCISKDQILQEVLKVARNQLLPEIDRIKARNLEKIANFVTESAPQYRQIVQRKKILDLLKKRLEIQDGSYSKEEAIHQLIFPMRVTSDEVSFDKQNLWIIDERLAYHHYLASDKPLKTIKAAESQSNKKPDILIFNRPIALHDREDNGRLESVVVIEFKRPGSSPTDGEKNPVEQILEYIELIQEGKAKSRNGRPLQTTLSTYFFGYVVCELDPKLKKSLNRMTMRETPDGRGMFGYFPDPHKAYIEVIGFDKMLDDANKRNQILFDKLQMP